VVAGAFDTAEARGLIEGYFGPIPRGQDPPPVECTDAFRGLPVRQTIDDPNARLPGMMITYGAVQAGHDDSHALTLLASILGQGESSRMHQRLVRGEQAALQAQTFTSLRRDGPGIFMVFALTNQGVEPSTLERLVDEEIARIRDGGVTEEELEKAKNRYRANTVRGRQSMMGRAEALQWHNHFLGDPGAIRTEMDRYMAVTRDDIRRVAGQYLTEQNRAVIVAMPATASED